MEEKALEQALYIASLLDKQRWKTLLPEEQAALSEWLEESKANKELYASFSDLNQFRERWLAMEKFDDEQLIEQVISRKNEHSLKAIPPVATVRHIHLLRRKWFSYAAAIIILIGVGAYLWTTNHKAGQSLTTGNKQMQAEILPGGEKAILTLADGSKIILDGAANGHLAEQGGVQVVKLENGRITYDLNGLASKEVMWNSMTTPRGGQYQITLPDGTRVWLNAASSITFPTAFTGKERRVKIDGEVYFEVAKNILQPFVVDVHGGSSVQVLGTSFNISSYQNDKMIKTTLVEGSIRVSDNGHHTVLAPGQQARISIRNSTDRIPRDDASIQVISNADIAQVLAWKNGYFNFEDLDLYAVMRQLERWYDIKVRYEGSTHNLIFQGKMFRSLKFSDVLELLQDMGVKCKLEGNTLIVY